jgi:hypothetical protein
MGEVMAENVNLLVDQTRTTSSFKSLWETPHEPKPSLIEDQKEELNYPREEPEQQSIGRLRSLKSKVKVFQEVRQQAAVKSEKLVQRQNQGIQQNIASAERRELQSNRNHKTQQDIDSVERLKLESNRQETSKDARAESRNSRSQGPAGANELERISEGAARGPQESLDEDSRAGNDLASQLIMLSTINRIEKLQTSAEIDSVKESAKSAREEDISVEQALMASQARNKSSIRDLAKDELGVTDNENLERLASSYAPKPYESETAYKSVAVDDAKTQERLNEDKAIDEAGMSRSEAALDKFTQVFDQDERVLEQIKEGIDANSIALPRPSKSRDASASSVETERGQNISKLI